MRNLNKVMLISISLSLLTGCTENIKPSDPFSIKSISFIKRRNGETFYDCKIDLLNNSYEINNNDKFSDPYQKSGNFSEEEEAVFVEGINNKKIYTLEKSYFRFDLFEQNRTDWKLDIEFENGEIFSSHGNKIPYRIFSRCAQYFYNICEDSVLDDFPKNLIYHPQIGVEYYTKSNVYSHENLKRKFEQIEGNYVWYSKKVEDKKIFDLCHQNTLELLKDSDDYTSYISINFQSYDEYCYGPFSKVTLKNYDYNEELTNEKLLVEYDSLQSGKNADDIVLEKNKIYLFEISYSDGLYVQYVFNTVVTVENDIFDCYSLNNGGRHQQLHFNKDRTCFVTPLIYLAIDGPNSGPETPQLNGAYVLTEINNQKYVKMIFDSNETLYLKNNGVSLDVDFDLSDLDFEKYKYEKYDFEEGRVYVHW